MRLTASDFMTYWRPSVCELRVFLHEKGEPGAEPGAFDEVMRRLGIRHEQEHLATLGPYLDLSTVLIDERVGRTLEAIANKVPVIYQPAFSVRHRIAGTDVEIVGAPDFLILDGDGYLIRDCKMSRHIEAEIHPEIIVQVQLYGWLFERSTGVPAKALQVYNGMKEIVRVEDDGGEWALGVLDNLLRIRLLDEEPYEPVGWSKCGGCGFNERCMDKAESEGSVALVPDVDQSLARTLRGIGVSTRKELLAKFDFVSLSELKRPHGQSQRRVGKTAERIIQFAQAMETQQEKILCAPAIPSSPITSCSTSKGCHRISTKSRTFTCGECRSSGRTQASSCQQSPGSGLMETETAGSRSCRMPRRCSRLMVTSLSFTGHHTKRPN